MSVSSIRKILIISGLLIVPLGGLFATITAYGPYVGYSLGNDIKIVASQSIVGFLSPVSTAALCLWAAHNLSPLSFLKTRSLKTLCSIGIVCSAIMFVFTLIETAITLLMYSEAIGSILSTGAYSAATLLYAVTSISLLLFARLQLTKLADGKNLKSNIYEETFS